LTLGDVALKELDITFCVGREPTDAPPLQLAG
jgi:hypothetical protein